MIVLIRILFVLLLFILGCGGPQPRPNPFFQELDRNINVMTFDDALRNWGPPTNMQEGDNILVANWIYERQIGSMAMPIGNMTLYTGPSTKGSNLQLTFDKATRKMIYWRYREW